MLNLQDLGSLENKVIAPMNDNMDEISYLDVKELYEIAYQVLPADGQETIQFNNLLKKAEMLDLAYRAQLSIKSTMRYAHIPENGSASHAIAA